MNDAEGVRRAFRCVRGLASDTRDFLEAIRLLASDLADGERLSVIEDGLRLANDALDRINAGILEHADFDLAERANIDHATPIQVGTEWHNFSFAAIRDTAFVCSRTIGGLLPVWSDSARRIAPVFAGDEGTPHYGDARLERECHAVLKRLDGFTPERIARLLAVLDLEEARTLRSIEDCPPEDPQRAPDGLTPAQMDIWRVVTDAGRRMMTREILIELDRRGTPVGDSAIKQHLALFTRRMGVWDNKRGRGYGFRDWP